MGGFRERLVEIQVRQMHLPATAYLDCTSAHSGHGRRQSPRQGKRGFLADFNSVCHMS